MTLLGVVGSVPRKKRRDKERKKEDAARSAQEGCFFLHDCPFCLQNLLRCCEVTWRTEVLKKLKIGNWGGRKWKN